jgi:Protein of unknown function (DUF2934)
MQVSPATQSTAKPARSKAKGSATESTGAGKTTRARKKAAPVVEEAARIDVHPTPQELTGMIATAAYFIAAERHFAAGHELDDWLEAERLVRTQFPD